MNTNQKIITKPTELLLFLKHLTNDFDKMTKDEYINRMRNFIGVYEYEDRKSTRLNSSH